MKKVLFATTALIATASMAAAEVRISGYGRFGLDYNDSNDRAVNGVSETNITSRLRLQFDMSTETDGGVTLGARFRAQAESRDNAPGGAGFNGARFFATVGGFTLGVGNIIGALENTPGLYLETRTAGVGVDGAGFNSLVLNANGMAFNWDAYSSTGFGANGVEVLYSNAGFNGHISYSKRNDTYVDANDPTLGTVEGLKRAAISLSYTWNDWTAAIGYQDSNAVGEDKGMISIAGDLGNWGVRFAYADNDGVNKYGLYGNVDIGNAGNLLAFVTREDEYTNGDGTVGSQADLNKQADYNTDGTGYGLHYSYDLGGGVSFEAGAVRHILVGGEKNTRAQAGVYFSF